MIATLTRRGFVARAGALFGALSFPALARARAQSTRYVFRLHAHGDTCQACLLHDRYKLFPTAKAAAGNRAHVGCNCGIQRGTIDTRGWQKLFLLDPVVKTYTVDRRSVRVRRILRAYPPTFTAQRR